MPRQCFSNEKVSKASNCRLSETQSLHLLLQYSLLHSEIIASVYRGKIFHQSFAVCSLPSWYLRKLHQLAYSPKPKSSLNARFSFILHHHHGCFHQIFLILLFRSFQSLFLIILGDRGFSRLLQLWEKLDA